MNAKCHAHVELGSVPRRRPAFDRLDQSPRLCQRARAIDLRQDDRELVAAEPADHVETADVLHQRGCHMAQRRIACGMAKAVIDLLHLVDVEVNQAARRLITLGKGQHARQFADEGAPVEAWRQTVLIRQRLQMMRSCLLALQVQAQVPQLTDEPLQRRADLGCEFALRDAQNGGGIGRIRPGAAGPYRKRISSAWNAKGPASNDLLISTHDPRSNRKSSRLFARNGCRPANARDFW